MTANQSKLLDILDRWGGHGTIEVEIQFGEYADPKENGRGFRTTRLVVAGLMRTLVARGWATDDHDGYDITDAGRAILGKRKGRVTTPCP